MAKLTRQLDDTTFKCILMRHAMEDLPASVRYDHGLGTQITFRCLRGCGTERTDWTDRQGNLTGRRYSHTDHYKAALASLRAGKSRPSVPSMRLELLSRARQQQKRKLRVV
jgi:hypothetical protein